MRGTPLVYIWIEEFSTSEYKIRAKCLPRVSGKRRNNRFPSVEFLQERNHEVSFEGMMY